MKQQDVFNKIGGIIKELNEQYKYLETDPDNINELELELFVANTHFLKDNAEVLRKINSQNITAKPAEEIKSKSEEKYFEPFAQHPENVSQSSIDNPVPDIDIAAGAPTDSYSYIREEPEVIRHELEVDESWVEDEDEIIETPRENVARIETLKGENNHGKFVQENAKTVKSDEEIVTVNQKISAQLAGKSTEQTIQPITDLKTAITLNEKLLYVKDLFNGYSLAYSEAIDILNRFKTFDEADQYLKKNYAIKNNWETKPQTAEKFYTLLRRRYF